MPADPSQLPTWWMKHIHRRAAEQREVRENGHEREPAEWMKATWLLRDALIAYGSHQATCGVNYLGPCTCGFEAVWKWANAADRLTWVVSGTYPPANH